MINLGTNINSDTNLNGMTIAGITLSAALFCSFNPALMLVSVGACFGTCAASAKYIYDRHKENSNYVISGEYN